MSIVFEKSDIISDADFHFFRLFNRVESFNHLYKAYVTSQDANNDIEKYTPLLKNKIESLSKNIRVYSKQHMDVWVHIFVIIKDEKTESMFKFYALSGAFDKINFPVD